MLIFEQVFKNIDDVLWKEAGCTTELDCTEQTSWLLFLKYLDGLEQDKSDEAKLEGTKYSYILDKLLRSEVVKEQIRTHTTGAAQPQVPIKTLINFKIPVPTSLDDQHGLVARLRSFEPAPKRLESVYQRKIEALDALKKSLLHQAFTGQL